VIFDQVLNHYYETTADAPFYPLILRTFVSLTGDQTINAFRYFSILIGCLIPLAAMALAYQMRGLRCAVLASMLFTVSEFMIVFATKIRPYSLFMVLVLCTYAMFLKHLKTGKHLGWLGVLIFLCTMTHLLTAQIIVCLCITALISHLLYRKKKCDLYVIENKKALSLLIVVMCFSGLIGVWWIIGRYSIFISDAIVGRADFFPYFKHLLIAMPYGGQSFGFNKYLLSIPFSILGAFVLFKKAKPAFILVCSLLIVVFLVNYLTFGNRFDWGYMSFRYYSHLIVMTIMLIAVGMDWFIGSSKHNKKLFLIIWVLFIILFANTFLYTYLNLEKILRHRDKEVTWFNSAIELNIDGIIYNSGKYRLHGRYEKVKKRVTDEYYNNVPMILFRTKGNNQYEIYKKRHIEKIVPGKFATNANCKTIASIKPINPHQYKLILEKRVQKWLYICEFSRIATGHSAVSL